MRYNNTMTVDMFPHVSLLGEFLHLKWPSVLKLTFHLENKQALLFKHHENIQTVVDRGENSSTMYLAWFKADCMYAEGRDLLYSEFPSRFRYIKDEKRWQLRQMGDQIGRLQYTPPGVGNLFYLRLLLTKQRGCMGYRCLKTVNGKTYDTYQEACQVLGLLRDDNEFIDLIKEASELHSGHQLRNLFVYLLVITSMANPRDVWNATWHLLSDGILYNRRRELKISGN